MNRAKELKRTLGNEYVYQRFMSDREVSPLRRQAPQHLEDMVAASLTVGCMKINAVLFQSDGSLRLGYDVYVKDSPGSSEWICFDCPSDRASLKEPDMLTVLDRIVSENGLSYTECCFERSEGILPRIRKSDVAYQQVRPCRLPYGPVSGLAGLGRENARLCTGTGRVGAMSARFGKALV